MGRRSFISMTDIKRWISASNRRAKEKEREELINSQSGSHKELPPTFELMSVDFNADTRATKLEFLRTQKYRTIERYVTQNYVRYPIYSAWKTRTKIIKKSIKLTNQELENLNNHTDPLIYRFAEEIIGALDTEELLPSWFIQRFLKREYDAKIKELERQQKDYADSINKEIAYCKSEIFKNDRAIKESEALLAKQTLKRDKIIKKINKAQSAKKSIFLYVFSFGFYKYFVSNSRQRKLDYKRGNIQEIIDAINNEIKLLNDSSKKKYNIIQAKTKQKEQKESEIKVLKDTEWQQYSNQLKEVQPLVCEYKEKDSFSPLKTIAGLKYEKIIGCYIIRNKENDKCYVGQSKDVLRRIKQHFRGTTPNNIVFAEDYYSSQIQNREDLFEVKIIPCGTKDELDRTEKQLISDYDSWNHGYNGTSGNT